MAHFPTARDTARNEYDRTETPVTSATPDELVVQHLPLVGHIVTERIGSLPAHVSRDELISAGYAALVQASRTFDPTRGVPFGRYAATRIRGALVDELRTQDWASRSSWWPGCAARRRPRSSPRTWASTSRSSPR